MSYVYILLCKNGKLYVGSTNNLKRRLNEHFTNRGCRFTKANPPIRVLYVEEANKPRSRELQLKKLSRSQKLQLIENHKQRTLQLLQQLDIPPEYYSYV